MNNNNSGSAGGRLSFPLASLVVALLLSVTLLSTADASGQHPTHSFQLVPEGQAPQGILAAARASRPGTLESHPAGPDALRALTALVSERWYEVCVLDVVGLSRFHVEATRGWQAPSTPVFNGAELLAADDEALYLMLRGPRLPASFQIVYRHLVFYARYDLASGQLGEVSVSIRGEVHE